MPFCGIVMLQGIPEIFLGGFIACGIYDKLGLYAHVEHPYTVIANRLGIPITPDLLLSMEGYTADVAVYAATAPLAVVELKVFAMCRRDKHVVRGYGC